MTSDNINNSINIFELTGKDVLTFLHNQVISDLHDSKDHPVYTAICNPKGRIIFSLIIQINSSKTFIAVDSSLSDNFLQYINMRKFRMDLQIKRSTLQLTLDIINEPTRIKDHVRFTRNQNQDHFCIDDFWLFVFKSGLPWITVETTEQFIPQHVNLDQSGVIAFDKGCYPGQEIVARLHFLGKIKKRMQHIQSPVVTETEIPNNLENSAPTRNFEPCSPTIIHNNIKQFQAIVNVD